MTLALMLMLAAFLVPLAAVFGIIAFAPGFNDDAVVREAAEAGLTPLGRPHS